MNTVNIGIKDCSEINVTEVKVQAIGVLEATEVKVEEVIDTRAQDITEVKGQ